MCWRPDLPERRRGAKVPRERRRHWWALGLAKGHIVCAPGSLVRCGSLGLGEGEVQRLSIDPTLTRVSSWCCSNARGPHALDAEGFRLLRLVGKGPRDLGRGSFGFEIEDREWILPDSPDAGGGAGDLMTSRTRCSTLLAAGRGGSASFRVLLGCLAFASGAEPVEAGLPAPDGPEEARLGTEGLLPRGSRPGFWSLLSRTCDDLGDAMLMMPSEGYLDLSWAAPPSDLRIGCFILSPQGGVGPFPTLPDSSLSDGPILAGRRSAISSGLPLSGRSAGGSGASLGGLPAPGEWTELGCEEAVARF
mmetsp:Transcript_23598/g.40589  ORF Transcript_23598/g.40589 Transcript_23598/m.40589 type:complete len:305 (-) Transcript_23598:13-927(-)|eukprot:CAMPEP_0196662956 /NCGR_PEP_ID=MMETSP1086-20130531/51002_1 /TAXON_ID=77921 /ORGANISM="Cyanoptyche  gloeocystis , Strain SAG4.97" /LENGTH=304 /DNA_ID=CAMNT_0041998593 /DNA_START=630 /DNA_END=1544 /DNA_ORIENTATION=+